MSTSQPPILKPRKDKKKFGNLAIIGIVICSLIFIGVAVMELNDLRVFMQGGKSVVGNISGAKTLEDPIEVSAVQLFAEYSANEIRADNTYKNQSVRVSGYVASIGKDIIGSPYVVLATNDLIGSVQCVLTPVAAQEASALNQGQVVTLVGKVSGKMMNVVVTNCSFAPGSQQIALADPTTTNQLANAAAAGDAVASRRLGERYWDGVGLAKDREKGLTLLRFAAEYGDREAESFLGAIYSMGTGVAKDNAAANKWNGKAAAQGDAVAQYNLALSYLRGEGFAENRELGISWLQKSAEQGNVSAQELLGKVERADKK